MDALKQALVSLKKMEETTYFKGFKIADLRKKFDKTVDADNWKAPWSKWIPNKDINILKAAIEYFHGSKLNIEMNDPVLHLTLVWGEGYIC